MYGTSPDACPGRESGDVGRGRRDEMRRYTRSRWVTPVTSTTRSPSARAPKRATIARGARSPTRSIASGCTRASCRRRGPRSRPHRLHAIARCGRRRSSRARPGAILTLGVLSAVGAIGQSSDNPATDAAVPTSAPDRERTHRERGGGRARGRSFGGRRQRPRRVGHAARIRRVRPSFPRVVTTATEILTSNRLVGSSEQVNVTTSDGVVHAGR